MKTSYRAIKKAKKSLAKGKTLKPWQRVAIKRGNEKIRVRKRGSIRMTLAAMSAAMGAFYVAVINSQAGLSKLEKALKISEQAVITAQSVSKAMQYDY